VTTMDEHMKKMQERAARFAQAASPAIAATAEALGPVLAALGDQFKKAADQARATLDAFTAVMTPRRRPARKACAWCTDRVKRPATHVVKWRRSVIWRDEFGQVNGFHVDAPGVRLMRLCNYHASCACRYPGVKSYRFRWLP
jgi:hypothetical protein